MWKLYRALRSKNACKTCALGMGGQAGGMVNERGSFPEVCKKSIQAMTSDMQPAITADFWSRNSVAELQSWSPRQLEISGRLIQPILHSRGESHFKPITWNEAFERIQSQFKSLAPDETFWYFSGRSSNEAGFLLQLVRDCTVPTMLIIAATIVIKPVGLGSINLWGLELPRSRWKIWNAAIWPSLSAVTRPVIIRA